MFSGGSRAIAPSYHVREDRLRLRPYNEKLTELTQTVCGEIEGEDKVSMRCLFEARTAFDCVLRNKVRQFSANLDNVTPCKHHIDNMKSALTQTNAAAIIDAQCEQLHYARKSFV